MGDKGSEVSNEDEDGEDGEQDTNRKIKGKKDRGLKSVCVCVCMGVGGTSRRRVSREGRERKRMQGSLFKRWRRTDLMTDLQEGKRHVNKDRKRESCLGAEWRERCQQ